MTYRRSLEDQTVPRTKPDLQPLLAEDVTELEEADTEHEEHDNGIVFRGVDVSALLNDLPHQKKDNHQKLTKAKH